MDKKKFLIQIIPYIVAVTLSFLVYLITRSQIYAGIPLCGIIGGYGLYSFYGKKERFLPALFAPIDFLGIMGSYYLIVLFVQMVRK